MARREYWLGMSAVVAALLIHALVVTAFPRYEWHAQPGFVLQVDRWKGKIRRLPIEMIGMYGVEVPMRPTNSTHPDQRFEPPLKRGPLADPPLPRR